MFDMFLSINPDVENEVEADVLNVYLPGESWEKNIFEEIDDRVGSGGGIKC